MDAIEFLKGIKSASVDLIVTDPAYESLEKHRSVGTTTRLKQSKGSSNKWFGIFPNERFEEFFYECYRVLKKNSHLYVMSDCETMFVIKPIGEEAGFKFWKDIIWEKLVNDWSGPATGMGFHYRNSTEKILFFEKGKRKLRDLSMLDVLKHPRICNGYPTEKPVSLMQDLIYQSSKPGDLVIDPFCGYGAVPRAAISLGRNSMANDIDNEAVMVTNVRLAEDIKSYFFSDQYAIH